MHIWKNISPISDNEINFLNNSQSVVSSKMQLYGDLENVYSMSKILPEFAKFSNNCLASVRLISFSVSNLRYRCSKFVISKHQHLEVKILKLVPAAKYIFYLS